VKNDQDVHYHDVNDIALVPLDVIPQPKANKKIELEVTFELMTDRTNRAMFNNITFNYPLVPTVFSALSLGPNATVQEAYTPNSFVLEHLDVVDLVIKNGDSGSHPLYAFIYLILHYQLPTLFFQSSSRPCIYDRRAERGL